MMLRLKAIAPLRLPEDELVRRQQRYTRLAGSELAVELVNLTGEGAPERLDTSEDIARSAELVGEEIGRTDPGRFDAVLPDCVLDPCVGEAGEGVPIPVPLLGILQLSAGALDALGVRFGAITRNTPIGDELRRKLEVYGLSGSFTDVATIDADFCLIADDAGWAAAMEPAVATLRRTGSTTVLNGCSAVDLAHDTVSGVRVVDPTQLALRVLAIRPLPALLSRGREDPAPPGHAAVAGSRARL